MAQENYLRATNKLKINENLVSLKVVERRRQQDVGSKVQPLRPNSNASSVPPEFTMRLSASFVEEANDSQLTSRQNAMGRGALPQKGPDYPEVPEVASERLTEEILSNILTPKS